MNMFDHDHSAARGKMAARKLIVFKHSSEVGSAPAHKLFEAVRVGRKDGAQTPARSYCDYTVTPIAEIKSVMPSGVEAIEMI